jgi:hypothetical protein
LTLHFGGPDRPARALSRVLLGLVEASGPGDAIHWSTYYFRDQVLARALMAAVDRGVNVQLLLEGTPRRRDANRAVVAMLKQHGLNGGLRMHARITELDVFHAHVHAKLYVFTGRRPVALFGSFNPSGDEPEMHPEIIEEIGDQDRGHNLLLQVTDPALVNELRRQIEFWQGSNLGATLRLMSMQNRDLRSGALTLKFFPRLRTRMVEAEIAGLGAGARIVGALSHVKRGSITEALCAAVKRGASVDLIVHDTERRVPEAMLRNLRSRGLRLRRYRHHEGLPVHAKYLLVEQGSEVCAWFGSLNFKLRARMLNLELLARCTDPEVFATLKANFAALSHEVELQERDRERDAATQDAADGAAA